MTFCDDGQAVVETALVMPVLALLFAVLVSAGQLINFDLGLTNAAAAAAAAAASAEHNGASNAAASAVDAVNEEQAVSTWSLCASSGSPTPPCVSVSTVTHTTATNTTLSEEKVVLYAKWVSIFGNLAPTFSLNATAAAGF